MTPEQWLKDPNQERTLLAMVDYLDGGIQTKYFSTHPYASLPVDTPANCPFLDLIIEPPSFSRRMAVFTGRTSASRSELTLFAHKRLANFDDVSVFNQKVTYLLGDHSWPLSDFITVAEQRGEVITRNNDEYVIDMRDPSLKLDVVIDTGLFSTGPNAGKPKPFCIGDVLNIEPVLEDASTHKYRVHYDAVNSIGDVRDNGVVVSVTKNAADGSFTLNQAPVGRITCDVQGAKPSTYLQHPGEIIDWLLTTFANETNIADLSVLPNFTIGIYQRKPEKLRALIDYICDSVKGYHFYSRYGQFKANVVPSITNVPSDKLTLDDVAEDGVRPRKKIEPANKVFVNYRTNYTQQSDGLAGSVTPADRALYSNEYQVAEAANTLPNYPNAQPIYIDTCLVEQTDAQAVADAHALERNQVRKVYEIQALGIPFVFELGQEVLLTYPDFGFEYGQTGIVIALEDDPTNGEVLVELWR